MNQDVLFFYIVLVGVVAGWQLCLANMRFVIWMIKRRFRPADLVVYETKKRELQRFVVTSMRRKA